MASQQSPPTTDATREVEYVFDTASHLETELIVSEIENIRARYNTDRKTIVDHLNHKLRATTAKQELALHIHAPAYITLHAIHEHKTTLKDILNQPS